MAATTLGTGHEDAWLEFPPISASAPARLIVFLHAAGSSAELIAPVVVAWQLKFPGATAAAMHGLMTSRADYRRRDWFESGDPESTSMRAADALAARVHALQQSAGITGAKTIVVGFSQGATLAIELVRRHPELAHIVVGYAVRLARRFQDGELFTATVHLIHGEFDSIVPVVHGERAYQGLRAVGADVSLDVAGAAAHEIDQELVNLGTMRAMQTIFRGRRIGGALH
jgi:phospholipase/carboxylesterase